MQAIADNRMAVTNEEREAILALRNEGDRPAELLLVADKGYTKLRSRLKEVLEQNKQAVSEINALESQLGVALNLKEEKRRLEIPYKKTNGKGQSIVIAALSDWHIEETVEAETVNQRNSYDLTIAKKRAFRTFEKIVYLTNMTRSITNVKTCVLAVLGDLISGYIHEELQESNSCSPTEALLEVSKIFQAGVDYLIKHGGFEHIQIVAKLGNHSRTSPRIKFSTSYKNNFEWLLFHFLKQVLEERYKGKVSVVVDNAYHTYREYFGHTIRIYHGDYIKYNGGIGDIGASVNKAISTWQKEQHADLDIFGHWHRFLDNRTWVSCGSLIGYNAFAVSIKAAYEPPSQTLFLIDSEKGKWLTTQIFVED
jgi:hypothetical protein